MRNGVAKQGHKFADDPPGEMHKVAFRIDEETYQALQQLTQDVEPQIAHGRQSVALRRAISEAFKRRK